MKKTEKQEILERTIQKFTQLEDEKKDFVTGYMTGVQQERAKWIKKLGKTA